MNSAIACALAQTVVDPPRPDALYALHYAKRTVREYARVARLRLLDRLQSLRWVKESDEVDILYVDDRATDLQVPSAVATRSVGEKDSPRP